MKFCCVIDFLCHIDHGIKIGKHAFKIAFRMKY